MPSNTYTVGDQATLTASFIDITGASIDPTTVTFSVRRPDGTTVTPTVVHVSTGIYQATQVLNTPGVWKWKAIGTGTAVAASRPDDGNFRVLSQSF